MKKEEKCRLDVILQRTWWIVSIIAGLAGICFTFYQVSINSKLMIKANKADQPVFQMNFVYWQSDTSSVKDHVDLWIGAKGEEPRRINDINIDTYLKFDYTDKKGSMTYYVPIKYYLGWPILTNSLSDTIAITYTSTPNNMEFARIYHEAMEVSKYPEYAFVEMVYITQIDYLDKYGEPQEVYFVNKSEETKKEAMRIKQISQKQFGLDMWSIDQLSITKIKEICGLEITI